MIKKIHHSRYTAFPFQIMNSENAPPLTPTSQPPPRILRIKRKRGQDPLQALILEDTRNVKRSKPSTPITSPIATPRSHTPLEQQQLRTGNNSVYESDNDRLNYMFKLAKTEFGNDAELNESMLHTILAEAATTADLQQQEGGDNNESTSRGEIKRRFIIQPGETRRQSGIDYDAADEEIPDQLANMVKDVVSKEGVRTKQKRKRRGHTEIHRDITNVLSEEHLPESQDSISQDTQSTTTTTTNKTTNDHDDDDQYVYDVYQLTDAEPLTTANHPLAQIGYIRFFNDDDSENNDSNILDTTQQDLDEVKKPSVLTDDEDSNAESFYQNDYPSDEDAEGLQELNSFEDEFDKLNIGDGEINSGGRGGGGDDDNDAGYVPHDGIGWDGEEYFDYGDVERFMGLDEEDADEEEEDDDDVDEHDIKRNRFFKSDMDDPLALHRDKIFGKLEKMISENK